MEAVIFIGIPASSKTAFYRERFSATHVRINLDTLKTRRREEALLRACLHARQPFVVDNTNVLAAEREKYIGMSRAAGYRVSGYFFQSGLEEALERNRQREGRAFIKEKGILAKSRLLQPPAYEEGFDRMYRVFIHPDGRFVVEDWRLRSGS